MLGQMRLSGGSEVRRRRSLGLPGSKENRRAAMAQAMPFKLGAYASCTDGACGQVSRIIVNPITRKITHIAVDPQHRHDPGRLVPVDLVDATTGQIRLRCTLAEFQTLPLAQVGGSVADLDPTGHLGNTPNQVRWVLGPARDPGDAGQGVTVNYVPSGEVDIRPELIVRATDDEIGQVQGLIAEPGGHRVTHVLLREGHMWGRKEVAIPIGAVTKIGTLLIHLSLTKHQVEDLPPVNIDHSAG
jgi:sporulation protein YlmC with PRC-barrel domain